MSICLAASIASAKSFVSSFYDVYLSTSASLEMICRTTLTTLIFTFLFLYYLEAFVYFICFLKLSQLKVYISTYKHDFIYLLETYLYSSTRSNIIDIEGYKLVCSDHPDNIKRGGVCIYYKESLPVRVINLPFFKEALLLEMCYNKKSVCVRNLSFPKPEQ